MASNYLNEILSSEGSYLPNISSKISELMNNTNTLKAEVSAVVENSSIQFSPLLEENESLKNKSINLLNDMKAVEEQIDGEIKSELSSCAEELKSLSSSLKEVKLFLEILQQLMEINTLLRKAREKMEEKEFYECTISVMAVQTLIKNNSQKLKCVEIFKILSQEATLTYKKLMDQISEIWSQCVCISVKENLEVDLTEISIIIDLESCNNLSQILKASHILKSNLTEKKFSHALLNDVLKKVILNTSEISSKIENQTAVLVIKIFNDNNKPKYLDIFDNIKKIIEFLKIQLDIEIEAGLNFLSKVGGFIADEFAECLIEHCLSETIPTCTEDLDKYKIVVEHTEVFEKTLQEMGFLSSSSPSLLDYAKNINVLFANKFCQSYLQKAKVIMKKDLHNVTNCEAVVSKINVLPVAYSNLLRKKLNMEGDVFLFPKCQISKQAEELMTLVHSMMSEIQKTPDLCAVRLFFTVRNIFEMYSAIVPLHHKKFLETLPHQVALFHNNCMYFTHNLINLASEINNKIPSVLKDHFKILLEEAVVLRSLAAETLRVELTNLKNHFIYTLRDSGFAKIQENPILDRDSEKCLRKCIRQLQILKAVWSEVLPVNLFNKAIGFLLDSMIDELISLILSLEDISSQTASDLVSSFTMILDKGPDLFPDSEEIHRHSGSWRKFEEFVLILKGSLRDIDNRWGTGLGPLAREFTAGQVKHLIRALFQNSERRAAVLARIW